MSPLGVFLEVQTGNTSWSVGQGGQGGLSPCATNPAKLTGVKPESATLAPGAAAAAAAVLRTRLRLLLLPLSACPKPPFKIHTVYMLYFRPIIHILSTDAHDLENYLEIASLNEGNDLENDGERL